MKLYSYWRSSASYRVRIALALKGIEYEYHPVHLLQGGGQQREALYRELNPSELVPTMVDGEVTLNQSLAIIEYLDERYPEPGLLPKDLGKRAQVRAFAQDLAMELQPLINLRVQQFLSSELNVSDEDKSKWLQHWFKKSFTAIEARLAKTAGTYCFGDDITLADVVLVPQVFSAQRFAPDLSAYPVLRRVSEALEKHPAFAAAHPSKQPDAES